MSEDFGYSFSFGPWNLSTGEDPFGPAVRPSIELAEKIRRFKSMGFNYIQFHDDDASWSTIQQQAKAMKKMLDDEGLKPEFVAPRLWFSPKTIDGGYTSNSADDRKYAIERTRRAIDIARLLDCRNLVLWLAW